MLVMSLTLSRARQLSVGILEVTAMTYATLTRSARFTCAHCALPLEFEDFGDLGLRPPQEGESREDYFDAELLDSISHLHCIDAPTR